MTTILDGGRAPAQAMGRRPGEVRLKKPTPPGVRFAIPRERGKEISALHPGNREPSHYIDSLNPLFPTG